ncbi:MAG: 2,3-dihydroxybiphenyl 1,2-dioxygenase [Gammaproteobacteria bacterium]|nr:MAG: 2,3-dihydroxybiphenyl 1,2-dioxygenase [Gammaproteobacteria bacterium]
MVGVIELGYLGLNVTDINAWREYATSCIGLEIAESDQDDRFYLRMDQQHHRITVFQSDQDDMAYMGWRVKGLEEFKTMIQQLTDAGVEHRVATPEETQERHVLGLIKLNDPSGTANEIYYSPQVDVMKPFHPGRPMYGKFVTGDQGLGHVLIRSDDNEAMYNFYKLLGLFGSIEYRIDMPDGAVAQPLFMSCNDRQHSIAFGLPGMVERLNHLHLQYTEFDDLGISHETIRNKGIDVAMQLGKHANDQLYTFYSATPSGWLMELGWGNYMKPEAQEHYKGDIFGHAVEASGYGLDLDI